MFNYKFIRRISQFLVHGNNVFFFLTITWQILKDLYVLPAILFSKKLLALLLHFRDSELVPCVDMITDFTF